MGQQPADSMKHVSALTNKASLTTNSPRQHRATSKTLPPDALDLVTEFWSRMIDEYGGKWEREYGQFDAKSRDVFNWGVKLLQVLQVLRKRHGSEPAARIHLRKMMGKLFDKFPDWPPAPAEFKSYVLGGPKLPWTSSYQRFHVERLPASTWQDSVEKAAQELPKIKASVSGGQMSREEQIKLYESFRKPIVNPEAGV